MAIVSDPGAEPTFNPASSSLRAMLANSSDRSAVEHFLCDQLRRLPAVDFRDQHEICDGMGDKRLLLKNEAQIVGHTNLCFREIRCL